VSSYQQLLFGTTYQGSFEELDCNGLSGWALDPAAAGSPLEVLLAVDGVLPEPPPTLDADAPRDDVCGGQNGCLAGFAALAPLSIFDGRDHTMHAYVKNADGQLIELSDSPRTARCPAPPLEGGLRPVSDIALEAWGMSRFWDELPTDEDAVDALPLGEPMPETMTLVSADDDPDSLWIIDGGKRRPVSADAIAGWQLDASAAQPWSSSTLAERSQGVPWPERPVLVRDGAGDPMWLDAGFDPIGGGIGGARPSAPPNDAQPAALDEGCGCRSSGGPTPTGRWLPLALAALAFASRRKRNQRDLAV
jgi:MYXO-CTERM domain-containing protein